LTKQELGEEELYSVHLSEDPRGAQSQRQLYRQVAERWQAWWEEHWQDFTKDEAYREVRLPQEPPIERQPFARLDTGARAAGGMQGLVLSPPAESGAHFYDLDTGLSPDWPEEFPRDEKSLDHARLSLWAAQNGVDLMCVTYEIDGQSVFALRAINMRLQEISRRDAKDLESFLKRGNLPSGRPAGELLLHLDEKTGRYGIENGAFLYTTREGGLGVIDVTDQITEARDITGQIFTEKGVGFHKGVKFNHSRIVP